MIDLWLRARAMGAGDPWPPLDQLQAELAAWPHGSASARLWTDDQGSLIGAALLLDESILLFCTPSGADDSLAAEVISWAIARDAEMARRTGERPCLFAPVCSGDKRLAELLERAGFAQDAWHTLRMERSLGGIIAAPHIPEGVVVRPITGEGDSAAADAAALHGALFAGGRKTAGERSALMRAPGYRSALDLVAVMSDGTVAGYVIGTCATLEHLRLAHATGWLEFIGVNPAQRGRGIGAALTLHLLHALHEEGLDTVLLTTGGANTAARHLFEGCGFHTRQEILWYVHEPTRAWDTRLWPG